MSEDNNPNRSTLPTGASRVAALLARRANTATSLFAEITARRIVRTIINRLFEVYNT
jgi:hypothetical protein